MEFYATNQRKLLLDRAVLSPERLSVMSKGAMNPKKTMKLNNEDMFELVMHSSLAIVHSILISC